MIKRKVGRPASEATVQVNLRLPRSVYDRVAIEAGKDSLAVGTYLRAYISRGHPVPDSKKPDCCEEDRE